MDALSLLTIIAGYLLGSLSSAIIICRLLHLPDPRLSGSNNPGATNVLRIGGKRAALLTLILDTLKGFLPVWAALTFDLTPLVVGSVALAAVLGHLFPIFFGFKGGKGVATSLGAILALSPLLALSMGLVWIVIFKFKKTSSLGALVSFALAPLLAFWLAPDYWLWPVALLTVIVFITHRRNLMNLYRGTEGKIDL